MRQRFPSLLNLVWDGNCWACAPCPLGDAIGPQSLPENAVGGGVHRWYQLMRQAFKLFNEYAVFVGGRVLSSGAPASYALRHRISR